VSRSFANSLGDMRFGKINQFIQKSIREACDFNETKKRNITIDKLTEIEKIIEARELEIKTLEELRFWASNVMCKLGFVIKNDGSFECCAYDLDTDEKNYACKKHLALDDCVEASKSQLALLYKHKSNLEIELEMYHNEHV